MAPWLVPTVLFTLCMGGQGILVKVALRHQSWQELILWQAVAYALVCVPMIWLFQVRLPIRSSHAVLTGIAPAVIAAAALVLLYIALDRGEVTTVVPVTSVYPVITVALGVLFLAEKLSWEKGVGIALIIGGLVFLTSS